MTNALATADLFISLIDGFDILNCRSLKAGNKSPLNPEKRKHLAEFLSYVKQMHVHAQNFCHNGLIVTLENIPSLSDDFLSDEKIEPDSTKIE